MEHKTCRHCGGWITKQLGVWVHCGGFNQSNFCHPTDIIFTETAEPAPTGTLVIKDEKKRVINVLCRHCGGQLMNVKDFGLLHRNGIRSCSYTYDTTYADPVPEGCLSIVIEMKLLDTKDGMCKHCGLKIVLLAYEGEGLVWRHEEEGTKMIHCKGPYGSPPAEPVPPGILVVRDEVGE